MIGALPAVLSRNGGSRHKRGEISWEGYADLPRFIDLAAANGLYVVVRIGPYICGEYFFGGLPVW